MNGWFKLSPCNYHHTWMMKGRRKRYLGERRVLTVGWWRCWRWWWLMVVVGEGRSCCSVEASAVLKDDDAHCCCWSEAALLDEEEVVSLLKTSTTADEDSSCFKWPKTQEGQATRIETQLLEYWSSWLRRRKAIAGAELLFCDASMETKNSWGRCQLPHCWEGQM